MRPTDFFTLLSDATRLRALMLLRSEGELCVCELTEALGESQPKISRHLALLRAGGVVEARRDGLWMHYRLSPALPRWAREVLERTCSGLEVLEPFQADRQALAAAENRPPERACG